MVKVKNKLQKFRFELGYRFAKDFAEHLEQPYVTYSQWENNKTQISLEKIVEIYLVLKHDNPQLHIEELLVLPKEI